MEVKKVLIGPEQAKEFLKHNTKNRSVKERNVRYLSEQMKNGYWQVNGDAIRISETGVILDGQHRLHAIIKSRKEIPTLLIEGLKDDVFKTIDTGSRRSKSDVLKMCGHSYANQLSGSLPVVDAFLHGNLTNIFGNVLPVGNNEILELLDKYIEIKEYLRYVHIKILPSRVSLSFSYLFGLISREKSETFFDQIEKGEGLTASDPVYHLRARLIENACTINKYSFKFVCALVIKTWKKFYLMENMQRLVYSDKIAAKEGFPEIEGLEIAREKFGITV